MLNFTKQLSGSYGVRIMNVSHWAWACITYLINVSSFAQQFSNLYFWFEFGSNFWPFGLCFHSECEISHGAYTTMQLIHPLLYMGLCVFFLCCVWFHFWSNRHRLGNWQKIATSWAPFTACVEVRGEGNPMARNCCHYNWASNALTVRVSLIRRQAWPTSQTQLVVCYTECRSQEL